MKFNKLTLYCWGVFFPSLMLGGVLALLRGQLPCDASQTSWWSGLPDPASIAWLFVLAALSTLLLFVVVFLTINHRQDQAFLTELQKLKAGEVVKPESLAASTFTFHPFAHSLIDFIQSTMQREARLLKLTKKDFLTSFETQNGAESLLRARLSSHGAPFDVIAVRITNLRIINDMYGFHLADNCIKTVADRLTSISGDGIRLDSGDLLWLASSPLSLGEINVLSESLACSVQSDGMNIQIDICIGVIRCPSEADHCEALYRRAWLTLEEASHSRQRIIAYHSQLDKAYLRRLLIIAELESVFEGRESELSLFYQPKVNLSTGKVEAAEALIRWHNPVLGQVFPDEFIPLAEQTGLMSKISYWVVTQAVKDLGELCQNEIPISIAVNLSAEDIADTRLLNHAVSSLQAMALHPSRLSIELTESQLVEEPEQAIAHLEAFRNAGFRVAVDDFGTGYSSLAYLKKLPIDELKIDKSFVLQLDTQEDDQNIVQTILALAERFKLSVVAEGVEGPQSLSMLKRWGCHWAQGYLVSRPLPLTQFIDWFYSEASLSWQAEFVQVPSTDGIHPAADSPVAKVR